MKISKETGMLITFLIGTSVFVTTAIADISTKSGYEQLKDSLKRTTSSLSESVNNFTVEVSYSAKDNNKVFETSSEVKKFDLVNKSEESISSNLRWDGMEYKNYYYSDQNMRISKGNEDTYYVTKFASPRENGNSGIFSDPFKEDRAEDIEKIVDAVVGNLKDYIMVDERHDGSKSLTGSLNEVQIPAIVNAGASFMVKQQFSPSYRDTGTGLQQIKKDIYVKGVTGRANINKDGILENFLGSVALMGKDNQGVIHEVNIDILAKIYDINSTLVQKPELTGKKVETNVERNYDKFENPQMFKGSYKNDIIVEKDNKFVKIGERVVKIESITDKNISGEFIESIRPEYVAEFSNPQQFRFDAQFNQEQKGSKTDARFSYKDKSGKEYQGNIFIQVRDAKIYFNIPTANRNGLYDPQFNMVLE